MSLDIILITDESGRALRGMLASSSCIVHQAIVDPRFHAAILYKNKRTAIHGGTPEHNPHRIAGRRATAPAPAGNPAEMAAQTQRVSGRPATSPVV